MTNAQAATIQRIKNDIPYFDFYGSDNYEIKQFEITDCGEYVSLYIVTGMKDDAGTLAAVFCRKYRHGYIGKRGGVSVYNDKVKLTRCSVFDFMNKHYKS